MGQLTSRKATGVIPERSTELRGAMVPMALRAKQPA